MCDHMNSGSAQRGAMTRIAGVVFVVGVVVAILNWAVIDSFFHRKEYRGQILTLYERLQPGMTKQERDRSWTLATIRISSFIVRMKDDGLVRLRWSLAPVIGFSWLSFRGNTRP